VFVSTQSDPRPTGLIPTQLVGLIDDAAVFPPGSANLPEAVSGHRGHRAAWYAPLVGPLVLPASACDEAARLLNDSGPLDLALVGDTGLDGLDAALGAGDPRLTVRQVEVAVAKRGEDPQPGLRRLVTRLVGWAPVIAYAEIPLTWGLLGALDSVAEARAGGIDIAPKFRVGGLAAELFPTPVELAAVICACRDRRLPFKLTAGLHNALRHTDPETGFVHHGFLNVLVAAGVAAEGGEVADVAEALGGTDPRPLVTAGRARRDRPRPLWVGFGSCSVMEPLTDLIRLGLIDGGFE
jgi:hypothetical protein